MIAAVIERCAGIDVGKKSVSVCLMIGPADQEPQTEIRTYSTMNAELERLRQWLVAERCTHAVLESTGSYWKPIFNVLEESLAVVLANAEDGKGRKGHKTDPKDSWWLAHLLRHAMIRPSSIPPRPIRELRDLTRRRHKLLHDATSERNRVGKGYCQLTDWGIVKRAMERSDGNCLAVQSSDLVPDRELLFS